MGPHDPQLNQDILDELRRAGPFASIEEVNAQVALLARDYNARPQAELGGLSPNQMRELLAGDWRTTGALRLNESLTLDDLKRAAALHDARTILRYIAKEGQITLTTAGNLSRKTVNALLPELRTMDLFDRPTETPRVVNEGDVGWLQILRHVLLFAGLLVRRRGLRVSRNGISLLDEQQAGQLYTQLFLTFFRTLDLRALDNHDRHSGLQATVVYSFYQLRREAREWRRPETLAETAWLPSAKEPPSESDLLYGDLRYYTFLHRVLVPLVQFGLMERRAAPSDKGWPEHEYRKAPLFDQFLHFEFRKMH